MALMSIALSKARNIEYVYGIKLIPKQADVKPNYAYFPIVIEEDEFGSSRQTVMDRLKEHDIYTRKYFYPLTSDMDCYKGMFDSSLTPVAVHAAQRVLTLPMSATLALGDVDRICDIVKSCGKENKG